MINFIKSELYRVFHTKGFYLFTGAGHESGFMDVRTEYSRISL